MQNVRFSSHQKGIQMKDEGKCFFVASNQRTDRMYRGGWGAPPRHGKSIHAGGVNWSGETVACISGDKVMYSRRAASACITFSTLGINGPLRLGRNGDGRNQNPGLPIPAWYEPRGQIPSSTRLTMNEITGQPSVAANRCQLSRLVSDTSIRRVCFARKASPRQLSENSRCACSIPARR